MDAHLGEEAERALESARRLSQEAGDEVLAPQHVLLGLLASDTRASRALAALGVDTASLWREVDGNLTRAPLRRLAQPPPTPRTRRVLELSREIAERMHDPLVDSGHLLLGLLREGQSTAAEALLARGVTLENAREELAGTSGSGPADPR